VTLTSDNFDSFTSGDGTVLVEFYAPWCGHCKSFAPDYEEVAKQLKNESPPVFVGKVDATVETDIAEKFDIGGYPKFLFFKNGKHYPYEGQRDIDLMVGTLHRVSLSTWNPPDDYVLVLTSENFDATIAANDPIMVEFYAPWCGHCKKLTPVYKKASQQLMLLDPPIRLAKVDCDNETALRDKYEVKGYPKLVVFRGGKMYDYEGKRDEFNIVKMMKSYLEPVSSLFITANGVNNFLAPSEPRIVGFFNGEASELKKVYFEAAEKLRDDFKFGHVDSKLIAEKFGYSKEEIVIYYPTQLKNDYEDGFYRFEGEPNNIAVETFVEKNQFSLVPVILKDTKAKPKTQVQVATYFDIDFSPAKNNLQAVKETKYWYNRILKIAKKYENNPNIKFVASNAKDFDAVIMEFGLGNSENEVNVAINQGKSKFPLKGEFSELEELVEKVLAGSAKPYIKSAKKPKKNKGPVKIVVGKTFNKIVNSKKKDVLIEFYAPWCGHCKQLTPIWNELGTKFKKEKSIVIAKMDATANDVPSLYDVTGFPTIYFVKRGSKDEPIKYAGGRLLDDYIKFLHEHSSSPITTVPAPVPEPEQEKKNGLFPDDFDPTDVGQKVVEKKGKKEEVETEDDYKEEL